MKTTINLSDFDFGDRQLIRQISDDEDSGFARVIVFDRFLVLDDIKQLPITAQMNYINISTNKVMKAFTHPVLSRGKPWSVDNNYKNVEIGMNGQPVPNPNFDAELEVTEQNFPYLKADAYDNFSKIVFALLEQLVTASVDADDARGDYNNSGEANGETWSNRMA